MESICHPQLQRVVIHFKSYPVGYSYPAMGHGVPFFYWRNIMQERVREAIRESGLSIAEIAAACGISKQAVYKWIRGKSINVKAEHLFEFERLTYYRASWLCTGKGHKKLDPKVVIVAQLMQDMEEYKKEALVAVCKVFAAKV